MAVTIPSTARRQPTDSVSLDETARRGFTIQYKGPFSALETAASSFEQGDLVETGRYLKSWSLQRSPGGLGILSLSCVPADEVEPEGGVTIAKKETWSLKSVRNDMSILAYCGPSEGANPNRYQIEMWMKESDKSLVDEYKFKDGKDIVQELSGASTALAEKIAAGIESVIRFYPVVVRKCLFSDVPADQFADIGFINAPPAPGMKAKVPKGLAAIISQYTWLKVQDDCDEQSDGDWMRVESWMGLKNGDGSWDEELYGSSRWPMPYEA